MHSPLDDPVPEQPPRDNAWTPNIDAKARSACVSQLRAADRRRYEEDQQQAWKRIEQTAAPGAAQEELDYSDFSDFDDPDGEPRCSPAATPLEAISYLLGPNERYAMAPSSCGLGLGVIEIMRALSVDTTPTAPAPATSTPAYAPGV